MVLVFPHKNLTFCVQKQCPDICQNHLLICQTDIKVQLVKKAKKPFFENKKSKRANKKPYWQHWNWLYSIYSTIELIKILCDVINIFFDFFNTSRST